VPRLGKVAQSQADARSLMTGRITDAYTNIATVKLFSHSHREATSRAARCRSSWSPCLRADAPGERLRDRQPRAQRGTLILATAGGAVAVDGQGQVGVGAVAAATAMACA
jgi:ATP-binding cassette, subfamily B, multidrug efflux pump